MSWIVGLQVGATTHGLCGAGASSLKGGASLDVLLVHLTTFSNEILTLSTWAVFDLNRDTVSIDAFLILNFH